MDGRATRRNEAPFSNFFKLAWCDQGLCHMLVVRKDVDLETLGLKSHHFVSCELKHRDPINLIPAGTKTAASIFS